MTTNTHSISQSYAARRFAKAMPVAVTVLIWLFSASIETGYVAALNSGIQQSGQTAEIA